MRKRSFFARFSLAQAGLAVAYGLSLFGVLYSASSQEAAVRNALALAAYTQKVHSAALSCRRLLKLSEAHADIRAAEAARREASLELAQTRSAARAEVSPEESAELDKLSRFVHASGRLLEKIRRLKQQGRGREAAALYDSGLKPMVEQYVASAVEERLRQDEAARQQTERMAALWRRMTVLSAGAFGLLSCVFFAVWTRRAASYAARNIARAQRALDAIRSGHFRITIEPDRADELGSLCTSLKGLAARLEQAQERMDGVSDLATDASRSLNDVIFAVGEYVSLCRQRETLDKRDEYGLNLILERVGRCNLLLGRLCESVAGQKLLAQDSPDVLKAIDGLAAVLGPRPEKKADGARGGAPR